MPGEQMELMNVYQYWNGERPESIRRIENTVRKIYTPERGYKYVSLTTNDMPEYMQAMIGHARIEAISDLYRYYLISKKGGVWIDSDTAFRKFIDFKCLLANNNIVVTTNVLYPMYREASTGILASHKNNPIIIQLYDMAKSILINRRMYGNYIAIGPALATSVLSRSNYWYCLPDHDWYHQLVDWSDYTTTIRIDVAQKNRDWYFAHFTGYNVKKWEEIGFDKMTVIEQTLRLIEREQSEVR